MVCRPLFLGLKCVNVMIDEVDDVCIRVQNCIGVRKESVPPVDMKYYVEIVGGWAVEVADIYTCWCRSSVYITSCHCCMVVWSVCVCVCGCRFERGTAYSCAVCPMSATSQLSCPTSRMWRAMHRRWGQCTWFRKEEASRVISKFAIKGIPCPCMAMLPVLSLALMPYTMY